MTVRVIGPREGWTATPGVINTTSRSTTWSRGLSPFYLGPVPLYEGAPIPTARNFENAWQFAKVYPTQVGPDGNPSPVYWSWATAGWRNPRAERYPMGKGAIPAYSYWEGQRLDYISARKTIYFPLYARLVAETEAFGLLLETYRRDGAITLWDFDGYDHLALGYSLKDVLNDPARKMGHAFVLAYLLERMR